MITFILCNFTGVHKDKNRIHRKSTEGDWYPPSPILVYFLYYASGMNEIKEQLLLIFSTPLYLLVIGIELCLSHFQHVRSYNLKDTVHNFLLSLLRGGTELIMKGISLATLSFAYHFKLFELSHSSLYWIFLLLFVDMMHYWLHRLSHTCRFFWAVHVNHHSSNHFNISVGFRSAVLEPFYGFLFFLPIAFCGFQPADILFIYAAGEIWAVLTHTEKVRNLGWLEYVIVTPSHHRVHHASNPKYLDKNMGTVFIIWDKLFGTFQKELPASAYQPLQYGLTSPLSNENFSNVIFHEWKNIYHDLKRKDIGWKDKWNYVFGPPGWSHDGSRLTSSEMRAREEYHQKQPLVPNNPLSRERKAIYSR